jgi:alkanesulfonate monooxygenase SsuD/methylene tetrahydromethanopterin reductase-like flavin-dependent oxidoreductase (luciferase family)
LTERAIVGIREWWESGRALPPPVQARLPIWGAFLGPRGARLAGRLGMGLLTLNPRHLDEYRRALAEAGHPNSAARTGGHLALVLSDDPDRDWPTLRGYPAYQRDNYLTHAVRGTEKPVPPRTDPDGSRRGSTATALWAAESGRSPRIAIMTPEDAVEYLRELTLDTPAELVFLWASIGAMPDSLEERHIELVCGRLVPALARL